ncbi:hypothetical protein [Luteolibacter sp. LG18]|uniref:hypothetical protein n=1 Tax=Luteolibacter sp. LG18 TaxID=2819286 RepID=UPI002B2CFD3E|nr:hypothetical protein llg_26690 [Luteolibacter sp. LG18]
MASGFRVRLIEKEADHPLVAGWWRGHGWQAVPVAMLPALGVMAEVGGRPVAAGWCYLDNSTGVAMLEWLVADPDARPREVMTGLGHVIAFLKAEARALGYGAMLGTCRQESLSKVLQRHEFEVMDRGMIHHVASLQTEDGKTEEVREEG